MSATRIGLVTVTHNPRESLGAFLSSIRGAVHETVSIVIADNESVDVDAVEAAASKEGAAVVRMGKNLGYGAAINAAVERLPPSVEYILVSNPDVVLGGSSIDVLVRAAVEHPEAGAFGPRILDAALGTVYPSARQLPSLRTGIGHALLHRVWPANRWSRAYLADSSEHLTTREAGWLSGACLLVRRTAFDQVGGFDAAYFMYFEDVDLGARLGQAGWKNMYCPDAIVSHIGGHSTKQSSGAMIHAHHASAYRYLASKYSAWYLLPLRLLLRAGLAVRAWWTTRLDRSTP